MASKIVVTQADIKNIVDKIGDQIDSISSCKTQLISELEAVNNAWKGSDATKYTEKMHDDYSPLLDEYVQSLTSYKDFLSNVYSEYSSFDEEQAAKTIEV